MRPLVIGISVVALATGAAVAPRLLSVAAPDAAVPDEALDVADRYVVG